MNTARVLCAAVVVLVGVALLTVKAGEGSVSSYKEVGVIKNNNEPAVQEYQELFQVNSVDDHEPNGQYSL